LAELAPHLTPALLPIALENAWAITDPDDRARALIALTSYLQLDQQPIVLTAAFEAVSCMSIDDRVWELAKLLPQLPQNMIPAAFELITSMSGHYRATGIKALAPYLPQSLLPVALVAANSIDSPYDYAEALAGLAPYLPYDLLNAALEAAAAILEKASPIEALKEILPYVTTDEQMMLQASMLRAANTVAVDVRDRVNALSALLPILTPEQRPSVVQSAIDSLATITDEAEYIQAATRLAPNLPDEQGQIIIENVLGFINAKTDSYSNLMALIKLAPYFSAKQMSIALMIAASVKHNEYRAMVLAELIPYSLPDQRHDLIANALGATGSVTDDNDRGNLLVKFEPLLRQFSSSNIAQLLVTIRGLCRHGRSRFLNDLAVLMPWIASLAGQSNKNNALADISTAIIETAQCWP
jgi:hypothetical protein